ncbi:hypothetical protein [Nocardioides sp.]|uniref:hypothetical protein n=1 Tax=Nocardioides sp. TaxID=35761 RepID=UPI003783ECC9
MAARSRSRSFLVAAAALALAAPLAIVAALASPASAAPGKPHNVYMYKVEKHVDLSGEFPDNYLHEHVYCQPGDIALDGMWRVDHVDQANPPDTVGDERDVVFTASYGDDSDRTEWHFRAQNHADGDAQIKLFVTCIDGTVKQTNGHVHNTVISARHDDSTNTGWLAGDHAGVFHSFTCPSGTLAVAPGFRFSNAGAPDDDHVVHLYRSWTTNNYRGWQWAFLVDDDNVDVDLYLRCLQVKTSANGSGPHAHNLLWAFRPGFNGDDQYLSGSGMQERRLNCDDNPNGNRYQDYKAMVGAFWIQDPYHAWYLGQDPRPKQRAFRYWWNGPGDNRVWHGALCIRSVTGKQVRP